MRPPGGVRATAATMVLTTAASSLKRCFRRIGLCGFRGHHRVVAGHFGRRNLSGNRLAHAMHGFRPGNAGHRHRPEGRGERNQQQESGSPAQHARTA